MNWFVTGGSRGIGAAIVEEAVAQGHQVAFTYVHEEERAISLAKRTGARPHRLDVRDSNAVEQVGDRVLDDLGSVDVVVSNAGINRNNLAVSMSDEEWREVLDTNLTGAFFVSRYFLTAMIAQRFGRMIFVSSLATTGVSGQANYAASKAGLLGLSATLAKEYGRKGITSNVISPGFFETDMTRAGMSDANRAFWIKHNPLGRLGELPELAKLIAFLVTPGAAYLNGQELRVDGGLGWAP